MYAAHQNVQNTGRRRCKCYHFAPATGFIKPETDWGRCFSSIFGTFERRVQTGTELRTNGCIVARRRPRQWQTTAERETIYACVNIFRLSEIKGVETYPLSVRAISGLLGDIRADLRPGDKKEPHLWKNSLQRHIFLHLDQSSAPKQLAPVPPSIVF